MQTSCQSGEQIIAAPVKQDLIELIYSANEGAKPH